LSFPELKKCHDDPDLSWKLNKEAAKATPARHKYVPYVEINGLHIDEDSSDLLQEICKVYRAAGGHTAGCSSMKKVSLPHKSHLFIEEVNTSEPAQAQSSYNDSPQISKRF
jgi:hypothetical protein